MQTTTDIQRLYEDEYGLGADAYQSLLNGFREHADRLTYVMSLIREIQPRSLLDVGSHRGLFGALVSWNDAPLLHKEAVDIVPRLLEVCWKTHGYSAVHHLNAAEPFFLHKKFDVVLCMELLEHVSDPRNVIDNCFRHTGQTAIFSTPEECGEIDGKIHVRKIHLAKLTDMISEIYSPFEWAIQPYFLPSRFCEKPHWVGWNYVTCRRVE